MAGEIISFFLRGRPVAFARAGSNGAHRFTPEPQRQYAQAVAWTAKSAPGAKMLEGPLRVTYRATFEPPAKAPNATWKASKPDVDNLAKLSLDSLNGILFKDDAQIVELIAQKRYGLPEGVTITVEQIEVA